MLFPRKQQQSLHTQKVSACEPGDMGNILDPLLPRATVFVVKQSTASLVQYSALSKAHCYLVSFSFSLAIRLVASAELRQRRLDRREFSLAPRPLNSYRTLAPECYHPSPLA